MAVPSSSDTVTSVGPDSVASLSSVAVTVTSVVWSELPSRRTDGLTLNVMLVAMSLSVRVTVSVSSEAVMPPPAALVKTTVSSLSTTLSSTGVSVRVPVPLSSRGSMEKIRNPPWLPATV